MTTQPGASSTRLLLVEPQQLLRRTVTSVAHSLELARIEEALNVQSAERLLQRNRYDALVVALDDEGEAVRLLERLRAGEFMTPRATPTVVMAALCDASTALQMKSLQVRRVLLKPFKVKSVLESIAGLQQAG